MEIELPVVLNYTAASFSIFVLLIKKKGHTGIIRRLQAFSKYTLAYFLNYSKASMHG